MSLKEKMTALADTVREKAELTGTLTIDEMTAAISDLVVNGVEVDARTLTVTPSKSQQTFTSSDLGENAYYSTVTVNAIPDEYIATADATAVSGDILEGKTAYINGKKVTGTIKTVTVTVVKNIVNIPAGYIPNSHMVTVPEAATPTISDNVVTVYPGYIPTQKTLSVGTAKGAATYTPGTSDQSISAGTYLTGDQTIKGDANLKAENIAEGVTLFGVEGNFKGGTDTSDATAVSDDILEGKTAYVNGEKVTGTIPFSTLDFNAGSFTVSRGYTAEDTVYDVPIMMPPTIDDNVVVVEEGYNNERFEVTVGNAIEGGFFIPGTSNIVIQKQSYLLNNYVIMGDSNLAAENIKTGVTIFNVEGTFTSDANATASDIASGKTAYVNGEKIVGTKKASGGVIPLWERYYARLFGSVTASSFVQNPVTKNGYYGEQFFVVDGKLIYRHVSTYSYPLIVDTSAEWTWAKWADPNAAHGLAIAIAGNSFYVVESVDTGSEGSSASTYRPPSMTVKCVASDLPGPITGAVPSCCWGNHVFSMNGGLFIADGNRYAHVAYKRELEDDPFVYVSVGKLPPEGVNGVPSYYFLTSSGDIACVEWESGHVNMDSGRVDWAENETLAEGNPFVNYRHIYNDMTENGTYELAIRSDGNMWFRAPGWKTTWSKVYINGEDIKFIATNELGYCESYLREDAIEDPDTGELEWVYSAEHSVQALHIDTQGRAWRFKSAFSGSSFTGVTAVLVDNSTDWQCVPPFIEKNKVYYVQKGGKLYRAKIFSDDDMELNMVEDPVQPSGKLVCSDTLDANLSSLWFAPEDAVIDMSHSGGTYTM